MPFFIRKGDLISTFYLSVARIVCFVFLVTLLVLAGKTGALAKTSCTFSHTHGSTCYNASGSKLTCKLPQGELGVTLVSFADEWTSEPVGITVMYTGLARGLLADKPLSWNGGERTNDNYVTKKNGKVTCTVYGADGSTQDISISVNKIDITKPTVTIEKSVKDWTTENVVLSVEASDSQSGLHAKAVSFDGGTTYTSATSYTVKKNGEYTVVVRDNVGNQSVNVITVDNIDRTAPSVSFFGPTVEGWTNSDVTLTVQAKDTGSGLAKYPYSFNGGENYTATASYKVNSNGNYKVMVKDKLGNVSEKTFNLTTIDKDLPIIKNVSLGTTKWVKEGVEITVEASDATSGIAKEGYSFDGGKNYTNKNIYTVKENGTVSIAIKDKAGNTSTKKVKIENIDNKEPEIVSISKSNNNWTKGSVDITVNAKDLQSGLADNAYSFDGGRTFSDSNVFTADSNRTIEIWVKDTAGNICKSTFEVDNIDTNEPVIESITPDISDWTSKAVTIRVAASDSASGLADKAYSFNGGEYAGSNAFKVTDNGTVTVAVKDKAGNISKKSIKVSNIDKENPVINVVNKDTVKWTKNNVMLTVDAGDSLSGLADNAYSFDGGKTFSSGNSFSVTGNGKVSIAVKDRAGNVAGYTVNITNIDRKGPRVSCKNLLGNKWTNKSATISVSASDDESGLADTAYSFNGAAYTNCQEFCADSNGKYYIKVRDAVGNESECSIEITNIDKTCPNIISINKSTDDWTEEGVTISVNASDEGSGLPDKAFSFDGGNTYAATSSALIKRNGTYTVYVRDNAGNVSSKDISIVNIGKDPSEAEKERLRKQKEAEEKERLKKEAEAEKERLLREMEEKQKELEREQEREKNAKEASEKELAKERKQELEKQIKDLNVDYEKKTKTVISLEQKRKIASENVNRLSAQIESEKKSSFIGGVIESFHNEKNDITPVEMDEDGQYKKVSVKDLVSASEEEAGDNLSDNQMSDSQDSKSQENAKGTNKNLLTLGIVLLALGIILSLSLNYIYLVDDKKVKKIIFVKVKRDPARTIISVPASKMKEDGKYRIFFSGINRLLRKDKPVYVAVDGMDNVLTTNEGKTFDFCIQ